MKKKSTLLTICSFMIAALMCVLAPQAVVPAMAAEVDTTSEEAQEGTLASGVCGENLTWVLSSDGTLTISGSGAMANYTDKSEQPWYTYAESVTAVVLEEGVTNIGNGTFAYCSALEYVEIPNSVTSIGKEAFFECLRLFGITIPCNVVSFGEHALGYKLSPYSDSAINTGSLAICGDTESAAEIYAVENGIEFLPWGADLKIRDGGTKGEDYTWYISKDDTLYINGTGEITGGKDAKHLVIGEGITSIGMLAFSQNEKLQSVVIPTGLTKIGHSAFRECSGLTEITFPDHDSEFGDVPFLL